METDDCCPLCMEDLDITDLNFRPCKCGYQICLFCYRHIKDDLNGLCPACRTPYDDSNVTFVAPDPQEMKKLQAEKKAREAKDKKEQAAREAKEKRDAEIRSRQEAQIQARAAAAAAAVVCSPGPLSSGGIIAGSAGTSSSSPAAVAPGPNAAAGSAVISRQPPRPAAAPPVGSRPAPPPARAVISVTGLSPRIAKEEIMRRQEYFGQYGKIMRVMLNNVPSNTPGPPSFSCQITYSSREEAEQAILAVDGVQLDGRKLKATHAPAPPVPVAPSPGQPAGSLMPSVSSDSELPLDVTTAHAAAVATAAASVRDAASREAALARDEPPVPVGGSRVAVGGPVGPVGAAAARDTGTPGSRSVGSRAVGQHLDRAAMPSDRAAPTPPGVVGKGSSSWATGAGDASPMLGTIGGGAALTTTSGPSALLGSSAVASLGIGGVTGVTGASNALASLGADLGPPLNLGADLDPILLGSGFEALLSGLGEDDEVSEEPPKRSRFARFFAMEEDGDEADDAGAPSVLRELRGVPLGGPGPPKHGMQEQQQQHGAAPKLQEDWQEGFRALLPNVNISFSGGGGGGGLGGLSLSGLDAIAGFPNGGASGAASRLSALDGAMGQPVDAARRPTGSSALNGLGANLSHGADLLAQLAGGGNGSGLAGLGGAPLSNSPLPLSSQLQNLLQCSGADASSIGDGGASLHSLFGGSGGPGLIPVWAATEALAGDDELDPLAALAGGGHPAGKGGNKKEPIGVAMARLDKPKKRGGSGNRGGKIEIKPPQK